jgi:hypothetical protein
VFEERAGKGFLVCKIIKKAAYHNAIFVIIILLEKKNAL